MTFRLFFFEIVTGSTITENEGYLVFCAWTCIWACVFLLLITLVGANHFIRYFTPFAGETFGMLISVLFIYEVRNTNYMTYLSYNIITLLPDIMLFGVVQ